MGFRCGFLGFLHMEIIQERLQREFDLNLVISAPSVIYKVIKKNRETIEIDNPTKFPAAGEIESIEEPWVKAPRLNRFKPSCDRGVPDERKGEERL